VAVYSDLECCSRAGEWTSARRHESNSSVPPSAFESTSLIQSLCFFKQLRGSVRREPNQSRLRSNHHDAPRCCFQPIHDRHGQIQNDDIGAQLTDFINRDAAILRFATNDPLRILLNTGANRLSEVDIIIINDENLGAHATPYDALGRLPANEGRDRPDRTKGYQLAARLGGMYNTTERCTLSYRV
jgi:hypothetical protein